MEWSCSAPIRLGGLLSPVVRCPAGRLRLASCVVDDGWPLRRAAERFGVSVPRPSVGRGGTARRARRGWGTAPAARTGARPSWAVELGLGCGSPAVGVARSAAGWARRPHRGQVLPLEALRLVGVRPPGAGCGPNPNPFRYEHAAPGTWCTWTSRSSGGSPTVAVTASWAGRPGSGSRRAPSQGPRTSTTPWMTTPGWCTPRSCRWRSASAFWPAPPLRAAASRPAVLPHGRHQVSSAAPRFAPKRPARPATTRQG